jgi:uncharacterized membrane protein YcaP (DUF421 family)
MDPLRLVVRTAFAFVFILVLVRVSGKRTVKQGDIASFVIALIIGDMFDDLIWAEVAASQFVIGVGTLLLVHLLVSDNAFRTGARAWQRRREQR